MEIKLQFNYQIFSVSMRCLEYSHDEQTLEKWTGIFDSWYNPNLAETEILISIPPMEEDYTGKFQSTWVILFSESLATLAEQRGDRSWSHGCFRCSNIRGSSQSHTWKFSEQLPGVKELGLSTKKRLHTLTSTKLKKNRQIIWHQNWTQDPEAHPQGFLYFSFPADYSCFQL